MGFLIFFCLYWHLLQLLWIWWSPSACLFCFIIHPSFVYWFDDIWGCFKKCSWGNSTWLPTLLGDAWDNSVYTHCSCSSDGGKKCKWFCSLMLLVSMMYLFLNWWEFWLFSGGKSEDDSNIAICGWIKYIFPNIFWYSPACSYWRFL